jgi:hypothetical protein
MDDSKEKLKSYVVMTRYVARRAGNWDSSLVPVGEYQTRAEAAKTVALMMPTKLAKSYKPKEGYVLVQIRIELYRRTAKGDHRLPCLSFDMESRRGRRYPIG